MVSLYIHIPFCIHRCAYCDFNTYAGQESHIPEYVEALNREIKIAARSAAGRLKVHTIFFGGGTPSLLQAEQFESILSKVREHYDVLGGAEISLEANPGTVTRDSLNDLHSLGFNRLSLGVQSAHPEELRQLERIHDYFDVINTVKWARQAGFDNLSLDLIFGLPGQSMNRWQATVNLILGLHPDHLSLYALSVEHGTPFEHWARPGLMSVPDPDVAADMYEWAGQKLDESGFEQYEISNWAKRSRQCLHNLQYWRNLPYLGFGAGAHGSANGLRVSNVLRIKTYIERVKGDPVNSAHPFPITPAIVHQINISKRVEMQETLMTGLRLTREGVSADGFMGRFGIPLREVFGREIDDLTGLNLLEWSGPILHLTKRGRLLGNQVFMRFVD
jgi:oxygen-independent coproporphyrinogen-3 oxidase